MHRFTKFDLKFSAHCNDQSADIRNKRSLLSQLIHALPDTSEDEQEVQHSSEEEQSSSDLDRSLSPDDRSLSPDKRRVTKLHAIPSPLHLHTERCAISYSFMEYQVKVKPDFILFHRVSSGITHAKKDHSSAPTIQGRT